MVKQRLDMILTISKLDSKTKVNLGSQTALELNEIHWDSTPLSNSSKIQFFIKMFDEKLDKTKTYAIKTSITLINYGIFIKIQNKHVSEFFSNPQ